MGYYTNFSIKIKNGDESDSGTIIDLCEAIKKQSEYYFDHHDGEVYSDGGIKWYEHEDDIKKVSKEFPEVILEVDGEGEESGDIWKTYWKNGKSHSAKRTVIVEEFDESKLS